MENTAETTAPTAEAPAVEKTAEAPVEKPSSGKLLDLARKEAEFIKKEVARKEEIAKLQEQLKTYEQEVGYFRNAKSTYRDNPEALLEKLGISYDDLTNAVLDYYDNKDKNPPKVDADSIRKEIEAQFRKAEEEKWAAQTQAVVENFVAEISEFVKNNGEQFPHLTSLHKPLGETESPEELIFGIVENYYQETGELLSVEAAAASAEEYFREEWAKLNGTITKTPPAPKETKSENKVATPNAPPVEAKEVSSATLNHKAFTPADRATITNNFAKPSSVKPYRDANVERKNVIERAVKAMEEAANKSR